MESLPLFPLSGIVLPGGRLPLRLFERRYIDMITDCLKNSSGFGVCLIESGLEAGKPAKPYPQGCSVSIVDFDQGSDGLLHITVEGQKEFEIEHYAADESELLVAEVSYFEQATQVPLDDSLESLADKLKLILDYVEPNVQYVERNLDDPNWVCYRLLELLPLASQARFELLRLKDNRERLDALSALRIELARR